MAFFPPENGHSKNHHSPAFNLRRGTLASLNHESQVLITWNFFERHEKIIGSHRNKDKTEEGKRNKNQNGKYGPTSTIHLGQFQRIPSLKNYQAICGASQSFYFFCNLLFLELCLRN